MAQTNVQAFSGDVAISSNLAVDTNTLFVDSVGNKVGIGTTNPVGVNGGQCLEGSSSTGFEYIATRDDTTGNSGDFVGAYLFKNADTDGTEPHYAGMSSKLTGGNGPMDLRFHTNRDNYEADIPQMIISGAGNVGIGKADPGSALDVVGDVAISSNLAVDTNTLFVDSVGNKVGIGTNAPQEALHVAGSMRLGAAEGVDDDNFRRIVTTSPLEIHSNADDIDGLGVSLNLRSGFSDSESNIEMLSSKSNSSFQYISFATATQERMRITSSGNVGIGTANPGHKLHVDGDIVTDQGHHINITRNDTSGGPSFGILNTDGTYSAWVGYGSSSNNNLRMVSNDNYPISFWTSESGNGVEKMRINASGNVGIGTDNPYSYQLVAPGRVCLGQLGLAHREGSSTSLKQVSHSNGSDRIFQFKLNSTSSWVPGFFKIKAAVVNHNGGSGFAWGWEAGFKVVDNNNDLDQMTTISGSDPGSSWFSMTWDGTNRILTLTVKDNARQRIVAECEVVFNGGIQDA